MLNAIAPSKLMLSKPLSKSSGSAWKSGKLSLIDGRSRPNALPCPPLHCCGAVGGRSDVRVEEAVVTDNERQMLFELAEELAGYLVVHYERESFQDSPTIERMAQVA